MGRPKDLPVLFQDLLVKYKSKAIADKEYKTYMLMAKVLNTQQPGTVQLLLLFVTPHATCCRSKSWTRTPN
jgi:hypothetical protein